MIRQGMVAEALEFHEKHSQVFDCRLLTGICTMRYFNVFLGLLKGIKKPVVNFECLLRFINFNLPKNANSLVKNILVLRSSFLGPEELLPLASNLRNTKCLTKRFHFWELPL